MLQRSVCARGQMTSPHMYVPSTRLLPNMVTKSSLKEIGKMPTPNTTRRVAKHPDPEGLAKKHSEYRKPYVLRSFIRDPYIEALQHIENRGMFRPELDIERSRFPRMNKTLTINTDGSLSEREFEVAVPSVLLLYSDRAAQHRVRLAKLSHAGRLGLARDGTWKTATPASPPDMPVCNALCFPYCVPSNVRPRAQRVDPADPRYKAPE